MNTPDTAEAKIREILDKHAEYYIRETMKFFQENGESPALSKDNPGDLESLQQLKGLLVDAKIEELQYLWQCENGRHSYFYDKERKEAFITADRIATLQQTRQEEDE